MAPTLYNRVDDIPTSVLTGLARRFFVDPSSEGRFDSKDMTQEETDALSRLCESAGIQLSEVTRIASSSVKLLNAISQLLSKRALDEGRGKRVVERLSERGELPLTEYSLVFTDLFRAFEELGVRRSHVESAFRAPDDYQHSVAGSEIRFPAISLFSKLIEPSKKSKPFVLLVQAERQAAVLKIGSVWRVPLKIAAAHSQPMEMLREFANEFGLTFRIGQHRPTKYMQYEVIPLGGPTRPAEVIKVDNPAKHSVVSSFLVRVSEMNVAEIALAYAIDISVYREFLKTLN